MRSFSAKEIPSTYKNDFDCFNWVHAFRTKNKIDSQEKVHKNHNFCEVIVLDEKTY